MPSDTEINPHICKVTMPAHTQAIGQELRRQGILYVNDKKALVATTLAQEGPKSPLRLINDGQPPKPLDGQVDADRRLSGRPRHTPTPRFPHIREPGLATP